VSPPRAPVDPLTDLEASRCGVYLHFPYCLSKCPYCDFASVVAKEIPQERYSLAIVKELELRLATLERPLPVVNSLFIGGGTPSLWKPNFLGRVLETLREKLTIADTAEVSLEANPGASDAMAFKELKRLGINRLSLGVQSFNTLTLAALGRAHSGEEAKRAYHTAREAGFDNVSMDFIYGVHGQTLAQVEADAEQALALKPTHLSAYALTLDKESLAEEVPLARMLSRNEVTLPPDETVVSMQRHIHQHWATSGFERYEISNYAQPGFHSRHNSLYWTQGECLALGVGATGFLTQHPLPALRYSNLRSAEKYLSALDRGQLPIQSTECVTSTLAFEERLAMGLRLTSGIALKTLCTQFDMPFEKRGQVAAHLHRHGFARFDGDRLQLTDKGFDLHSDIAAQLM
jgi:putative oxygen-independent coproporphyrinogen III oxidase